MVCSAVDLDDFFMGGRFGKVHEVVIDGIAYAGRFSRDGFLPSRIGHADLMTGLHELLRQSPADMPDTNDTYIHIHASYILKVLYILYTRGKREGTGETNYSSE